MAKETEIELPEDVRAALAERGPSLGGHQLLLLPGQTRDGKSYYLDEDIDSVNLAKDEGLDAAFLFDGEERRYLEENAAGWVLQVLFAVGENLGANGVWAISGYLLSRVRGAKKNGLYEGEESAAPIKLTLTQTKQNGSTGDVTTSTVLIEGDLDSVTTAAIRLLEGTTG